MARGSIGTAGLAFVLAALSQPVWAEPAYVVRDTSLLRFELSSPQIIDATVPISGLLAGEVLAGIDFRPVNGFLYGLGVNPTANNATLYAISTRTGVAVPVGASSQIAFVDSGGAPVDLPSPLDEGYGFDFNPAADRVRVTAGALNFRINPNTGAPLDGNLGGGVVAGTNPDGATNGGTTSIHASAYTNNDATALATTLYTLSATDNTLFIQNPANSGTQTMATAISVAGQPLDFAAANGFDIPVGVRVASSGNAVAAGQGYAALTANAVTRLYRLNLVSGEATPVGNIGDGSLPVRGLAVQPSHPGVNMLGLSSQSLVLFNSTTPSTMLTVMPSGLVAGERLVGLDWRPQTGQLFGLGINASANTGTLYVLDPRASAVTVLSTSAIALTADGVTAVDFPDVATAGYGFDFNPNVDRIRVTTSSGLNFRINPITGAPIDFDVGISGINPDVAINGSGTQAGALAYTNNFGQSLTGGVSTLYALDPQNNELAIMNPANSGTLSSPLSVISAGTPLDFSAIGGFDIGSDVAVASSAAPASGFGYAVLFVGAGSNLYRINLANGQAQLLANLATVVDALTISIGADSLLRDGFE